MMRCYVAGKAGDGADAVGGVITALLAAGHEVPYDWRDESPRVVRPYLDNTQGNRIPAMNMRQGVLNAQAVILCWDERLLGGLLEVGMALANKTKPVYLLKPDRQSIYWTLRQVRVVETVQEVIKSLNTLELIGR